MFSFLSLGLGCIYIVEEMVWKRMRQQKTFWERLLD